jgi:hypothetical protein
MDDKAQKQYRVTLHTNGHGPYVHVVLRVWENRENDWQQSDLKFEAQANVLRRQTPADGPSFWMRTDGLTGAQKQEEPSDCGYNLFSHPDVFGQGQTMGKVYGWQLVLPGSSGLPSCILEEFARASRLLRTIDRTIKDRNLCYRYDCMLRTWIAALELRGYIEFTE